MVARARLAPPKRPEPVWAAHPRGSLGLPFRQLGIFNWKCLVHPAAYATVIVKFIPPAGVGEDRAGTYPSLRCLRPP